VQNGRPPKKSVAARRHRRTNSWSNRQKGQDYIEFLYLGALPTRFRFLEFGMRVARQFSNDFAAPEQFPDGTGRPLRYIGVLPFQAGINRCSARWAHY
jgi:hypothetical protein